MTIITSTTGQQIEKGLSISTSNVLEGVTPTITSAGTNEVAANISDPDHSLNYTSGTSAQDFTVSYGAQTNISYVAVSGHNAATQQQATIELYNDATLIDSVVLRRNHNVMFTFQAQAFQDLRVKFITAPATYQTTVSFIAAGEHLTIATGEQAGYKRNWLNRHLVQSTRGTLSSSPISTTQKSKALNGSLVLPNLTSAFSRLQWQTFIDFAFEQPFFMKEVVDQPESSYICFDPSFDTSAHSQTTALDSIKLKFNVFNGL
jgi:hypothetical protein